MSHPAAPAPLHRARSIITALSLPAPLPLLHSHHSLNQHLTPSDALQHCIHRHLSINLSSPFAPSSQRAFRRASAPHPLPRLHHTSHHIITACLQMSSSTASSRSCVLRILSSLHRSMPMARVLAKAAAHQDRLSAPCGVRRLASDGRGPARVRRATAR